MRALRLATLSAILALAVASAASADPPAAYQGDPGHTGFAPATSFAPPLGKRWIRSDLGFGLSYPIFAEGKVIVTSSKGVFALDSATGVTVWSRNISAAGGASYDAGRVFVVSSEGILQALSASNGAVAWTTTLHGSGNSFDPPTAFGGDMVYVVGGNSAFGVRESDGLVVFSTSVAEDRTIPAVDDDHVYTVSGCSETTALQRKLGVPAWHYSSGCFGGGGTVPVVYRGHVYVADHPAVVLDATTGRVVDSFSPGLPPAMAGDAGYFASGSTVTARSLVSGTTLWQSRQPASIVVAPLVAGAYVYGFGADGKPFALDRSNGARAWESDLGLGSGSYGGGPFSGYSAGGDRLVLTVNEYDGPSVVAGFSPGADTPGLGPPPPPPARITMSAEKTSLVWAAHTALHGTVSQWTHGSRVEVHASTFPFTSERVIATYTDRADFFVPISPVRNTVYWATYGDLKTARVPVFMDLWQKGLMTGHGSHTHLAVSFKGPAGAPLARRRVFTYVYRAAERRAVRLGSMRLGRVRRRGGSDFAKARRRVTAPRRRRGDYLFFCLEEKHDDGFGKPDPADAECGHRILH